MRRLAVLLLTLCLCWGLSGCDFWMNGTYARVSPHQMSSETWDEEKIEVSSYHTLYQALCTIVESGASSATFYYPAENVLTIQGYMDYAVAQVCANHPIGSYAVDKISYEVGTRGGVQAIAIKVNYDRTLSDIRYINRVAEVSEGVALICQALDRCSPSATFLVESFTQTDFVQLVKNYVDDNPDVCMEMPQVTVATYPKEGASRVVEILFTYENSREDLRAMQKTVAASFDSALLSVSDGASSAEKCKQLYRYLSLLYAPEALYTSITPAYSLLHHGVGDSKAYATVYAAMCRKVGVDCDVVVGTLEGKPRYWNAVKDGGGYLYVDILYCAQEGRFELRSAEQMKNYVWDYSAYGG